MPSFTVSPPAVPSNIIRCYVK